MAKKSKSINNISSEEISEKIVSKLTQTKTLPKKAVRVKESAATKQPGANQQQADLDIGQTISDSIAVALGAVFNPIFLGMSGTKVQTMTQLYAAAKNYSKTETKKGIFGTLIGDIEDIKKIISGEDKTSPLTKLSTKFNEFNEKVVSRLDSIITAVNGVGAEEGAKNELDVNINANQNAGKFLENISNEDLSKRTKANLMGLAEVTGKDGALQEVITNMNEAGEHEQDIENYRENVVKKLAVVNDEMSKLDNAKEQKFDSLKKSQENVKKAVGKMDKSEVKQIKVSISGWVEMAKAVAIAAGVLLLGAMAMKYVNKRDLLDFTKYLAIFLVSVIGTALFMGRFARAASSSLRAATGLVAGAALIMLAGSLIMPLIDVGSLILFTVTLSFFLFSILGVLAIVSKLSKGENLVMPESPGKKAKRAMGMQRGPMHDAMKLVAGAAIIMLVGSLIMPAINLKNIFLFTFTLGLFLFTIYGIVALVSKWLKGENMIMPESPGKKAKRAMGMQRGPLHDAMKLVLGSALLMFIGALAVDAIKPGKLIKFTLYLGGFLLAIGLALKVGRKGWRSAGRGSMAMVALATLIMFIGSMAIDEIPIGNLLKYTVTLSLFLLGVGLALRAGGRGWNRNMREALAISITVGILSAVMLGAGMLYLKNPGLDAAVAVFCVTATLFMAAMVLIMKWLSKSESDIIKGGAAMAILGGVSILLASSFLVLAMAIQRAGDINTIWEGFGIMTLMILGLSALCIGLGAAAEVTILGAAVLGALALSAVAVASSLLILAHAMEKFSQIKEFDVKPILKNVSSIVDILWSLMPIGALWWLIAPAELVILGLVGVLELMANAVKDYAELKVPIYAGTKIAGYRQLQQSDFSEAGKNVELIIKTLSKAVIDATLENPEYFEWGPFSKLSSASKALSSLGPMLSKIANAVKDYAELKVPVAWNSDGKVKEYRHLEERDFVAASENVKKVITVLGGAIVKVYNANPELYTNGDLISDLISDNPFVRVIKSNMQLAKLISTISQSVLTFASGQVPLKWDKEGKPIKFEHLGEKHFQAAEKNIISVIRTLGGAITKIAKDPDMEDLYGGAWGNFFGVDSKFTRVVKANMKLGEMISKIGASVRDFASGKIETKWDSKTGKPIAFEQLNQSHFKEARKNISYIISTLGKVIVEQANNPDTKDLYGSAWGNFFGVDNKFTRVVNANIKLGEMISLIGKSVKGFADLKVEDEWDPKTGKPIHYKQLKTTDFVNASNSITQIIQILGETVAGEYKTHKAWYDDDDDNPLPKVIDTCKGLAKIMSEMAAGMKDYADLKIPQYDENGKIKSYKQLSEEDFVNAGNNISHIISIMTGTLMSMYDMGGQVYDIESKTWKKNTSGKNIYDGDKEDNPLFIVLDVATGIAKLVGEVGKGVKEMSESQYVDQNGKKFKLDDKAVSKAGENVANIVTGLLQKLLDLAADEKYSKYFQQNEMVAVSSSILGGTQYAPKDSEVKVILDSVANTGQLISGIAQGVQMLAQSQVIGPNGKPKSITKADFDKAATNIASIITSIGKALMDTYGEHKDWFQNYEIDLGGGGQGEYAWGLISFEVESTKQMSQKSPFQEVLDTNVLLGQLISSIAQGVVIFAQGLVPGKDGKPIKITDDTYSTASTAIEKILTATGSAIVRVANTSEFATTSSPKLKSAVEAVTKVGGIVTDIAESIKILATGQVPTRYNDDGQVVESIPINDDTIAMAAVSISMVLTAIGSAIGDVASNPKFANMFNVSVLEEVKTYGKMTERKTLEGDAAKTPAAVVAYSVSQMAGMIGEIADAVVKIGTGTVPELDAEGKPTGKYVTINIPDAIANLKKAINDIISGICDSFKEVIAKNPEILMDAEYNYEDGLFGESTEVKISTAKDASKTPFMIAATAIGNIMGLIGDVTDAIINIACMRMPVYKNGQLDHYEEMDVPKAVGQAVGLIEFIFEEIIDTFVSIGNNKSTQEFMKKNSFLKIDDEIGKMFGIVGDVTQKMIDFCEQIEDPEKYAEKMGTIIGAFKGSVNSLIALVSDNLPTDEESPENAMVNSWLTSTMVFSDEEPSQFLNQIKDYSTALQHVITAIQSSEGIEEKTYNALAKGITTVSNASTKVKDTKNFNQQTNILDKFIKSVNTIKVYNLDKLTSFINSMNFLALKMGNLDQLTKVLSEKMAGVLEDLTKRLEHAEQTIQDADRLQIRRHELITDSVNKVREIMQQQLTVEVTANGSGMGQTLDGGGGGGIGLDGSIQSPTPLGSPSPPVTPIAQPPTSSGDASKSNLKKGSKNTASRTSTLEITIDSKGNIKAPNAHGQFQVLTT